MNRTLSPLDEVNLIGKLADLKLDHYKHMLILNSMIDLLIEKGLLEQKEIQAKISALDALAFTPDPTYPIS